MRWPATTIARLEAAVAAARSGTPTVLAIHARAGFGKSTLLRAGLPMLGGFHILRAYGEQSGQNDRFQLLAEWDSESGGEPPRHTAHATRLLLEAVDTLQLTGPVALVIDDLQWIDPDSVDALTAVAERAVGDRLLVLAAYRPLGRRHPAWRRLGPPTVHLDGLQAEAAADLVAAFDPAAPPELAQQLRAHTGGSPLHMRALLQEHAPQHLAALAARGELPAPADLADAIDARLAHLAPDAARLLHALAVLGDTWTDLPTASAVAGVDDPGDALGVLAGEELLRIDEAGAVPRVRIVHAVVRAAAYGAIPRETRRRMHRAAAARLTGTGDRLGHRLAASLGPDDGLAADLERHADDLHRRARLREAARFRRRAAAVTTSSAARERRLLDADIDSILAREISDVSVTTLEGDDSTHRQFVHAHWLNANRRWVESARVFDDLDPDALDPLNAYRARVLRAWTTIGAGRPPADALPDLEAAEAAPVRDDHYHGVWLSTYGEARVATAGPGDPVWGIDELRHADRAVLAGTREGLLRLSWRGGFSAVTGSTETAVGDLTVITRRMDDGTLPLDDGVALSLLGFAQWCRGEWRRASISIGLALASHRGLPTHPYVLVTAPLAALATGEDPRASLARSRDARLSGPAPVAIRLGDVVDIVVLALTGTPRERRDWRARRTADFGAPLAPGADRAPALWMLAMGIGVAWAADADGTDAWADALAGSRRFSWQAGAVAWLRALAQRLRGRDEPFVALAPDGLPGLDSFTALLALEVAHDSSDPRLRQWAETSLTRIDGGRHITAFLPDTPVPADPLALLSDRERDVAALLLEGLSYAQIAEELHVSRSTVAFHLSNVYAKTDTSSRHGFVQLCRRKQR